jgi:zinc transporter ZupT
LTRVIIVECCVDLSWEIIDFLYINSGDFAMLLNAGMSAKQALVYNCVSSILCLLGMIIGVVVGNIAAATTWIFAVIAGLFLYVALVDMVTKFTYI